MGRPRERHLERRARSRGRARRRAAVSLPDLTGWRYRPESPEAQPSFDDSAWANADKTTSNSRTAVPSGQKVLFADDYGFHNGPVWYRGTYSGAAPQVRLAFQTGTVGLLQAWLDGQFLGSSQTPVPTSGQATTATWSRPRRSTSPPRCRPTARTSSR